MGLFDAFSSSDERKTLQQGNAAGNSYDKKGLRYSEKYTNKAADAATSGTNTGLTYLGNTYGTATDAVNTGATSAYGYLDQGASDASGAIQQGIDAQKGLYDRGVTGIDDYYELLTNPDSIYNSQIYQSNYQQGVDELNRVANSRGMLSSGNNTQDIIDYTMKHGLDYWDTTLGNYEPFFGLASSGASGMQSGYTDLGNLYEALGQNKAGVATNTANSLASLASEYGKNASGVVTDQGKALAAIYGNQGTTGANTYSGMGDSTRDTYTSVANADSAANANIWSALLGLGSAAAGGVGAYTGAGGTFS